MDEFRKLLTELGIEWRGRDFQDRTWFNIGSVTWLAIKSSGDDYIALNACLLTPQEARDIVKSYSSFLNTENMHADLRKLAKDLHTLTQDILPEKLRKLGIEADG